MLLGHLPIQHLLFLLHSSICILDFNISNIIQPLISGREEIDVQHKVFPSKSQFLLMHREPTEHSVAQMQTFCSRSTPSNWEGEVNLVPLNTTFSHPVLRSPGDCWAHPRAVGCSCRFICGHLCWTPGWTHSAALTPHRASSSTGTAPAKGFRWSILTGSNPQTSHFPPCPPLPLKCLFAGSFRTEVCE